MSDTYLIAGLGNPGARYDKTRHNIGFMIVDALASRHGLTISAVEQKALVVIGTIRGRRVLLVKPQTFMNVSGESVVPLARYYKVTPERMMIVHDDLDIPAGAIRLRKSGSSGGQKGVKHIIERMGTPDFPRLRAGIGRPPGRMDPAAYVLRPFEGDDAVTAVELVDRGIAALETWLVDGMDIAMTRHNNTPGKERAHE